MKFTGGRRVAAAMMLALAACGGGGQPAPTGPKLPPPDPNAPLPPSPPRSCTAPLALTSPKPDLHLKQAAALKVTNSRGWWTRSLMGPYPDREEAIADCTDATSLPAAPPFDAIAHCTTSNPKRPARPNNLGRHILLLRTARGWWRHQLAQDRWPRGDPNDQPSVVSVHDLVVSDRLGDGLYEVSAIVDEGPPGSVQVRRLLVCGVGKAAVPACADLKIASNGPLRGAGTLLYNVELTCDGTLSMTGWEGGLSVRLVHTSGQLAFP